MAAACGFDAVHVDLEHSAVSIETMSMLCTVARHGGLTPLVRIGSGAPEIIDRVLGIGPAGVIVSHVETREQAEAIVRACRFPPQGTRSVGGTGASSSFQQVDTATAVASPEAQAFVAVMVESRAGVDNVEAIAAVDGVDMLVAGPHDLTTDMGIPGRFDHPHFLEATGDVAAACRASGTVFGIAGIADLALLEDLVAKGLRYVSAGTDSGFFVQAASTRVRQLRTLGQ
jgi:2-keto-3-deoxy-L-rhamnonate aldolase RhmA